MPASYAIDVQPLPRIAGCCVDGLWVGDSFLGGGRGCDAAGSLWRKWLRQPSGRSASTARGGSAFESVSLHLPASVVTVASKSAFTGHPPRHPSQRPIPVRVRVGIMISEPASGRRVKRPAHRAPVPLSGLSVAHSPDWDQRRFAKPPGQ